MAAEAGGGRGDDAPSAATRSLQHQLAQKLVQLSDEWNRAVREASEHGLFVEAGLNDVREIGMGRPRPLLHCRVSRELTRNTAPESDGL